MGTHSHYTIVGVFVLTLLTSVILGIIWLSSGFSFDKYKEYRINMQESISGLNIDSSVEFNGVLVGSVESIELSKSNAQLVELLIKIKSTTPVTQGTVATLATRGLTGMVYLALKDDSHDKTPLLAKEGEEYPVIPTAPSIFMRLDTALTELNKSFQDISHSFSSLLDPENREAIRETLANLKDITHQFIPLMKSTGRSMRFLETQMMPMTYQLFNNLEATSQQLSELTVEVKQNPSILIRGKTAPVAQGASGL